MKKEKTIDMLLNIDSKIQHIEDAIMDHREVLIKLVKQNNQIVKFLKDFSEDIDVEIEKEYIFKPKSDSTDEVTDTKLKQIQELIDEYMEKNKGLQELEEELKKNKDKIIPGQMGES